MYLLKDSPDTSKSIVPYKLPVKNPQIMMEKAQDSVVSDDLFNAVKELELEEIVKKVKMLWFMKCFTSI